jgi:hypothetical protein
MLGIAPMRRIDYITVLLEARCYEYHGDIPMWSRNEPQKENCPDLGPFARGYEDLARNPSLPQRRQSK